MALTIDYRRMVPTIPSDVVESYRTRVRGIHDDLLARRKAGGLPFYELPRQDLGPMESYVARVKGSYSTIVVLGIGGSSLGLLSLNAALRTPYPSLEPEPRLVVLDNIDPVRIGSYLSSLDPARTLLNVITKSGDTAETMSEFLIFRKWFMDALGTSAKDHIVATTDRTRGALRKIAGDEGYATFEVPDGVGGRFSVLTPVGLLPAALLGMDIRGLLAGAAAMDKRLASGELMENPAYLGAALHHAAYAAGRPLSVMFAYADQLYLVADWYRQLWAESLGKRVSRDGTVVSVGPTPIKALGVTDQHSQVQLYKEGPDDKVYTFLAVEKFSRSVPIPSAAGLEALAYLGGHTLNELLAAEEKATEIALSKAGRPVSTITFPEITAGAIGEFYHLLEVQTVAAGALFQIDPLDQPGVEEGKQFAYGLMGRKGFEAKRREAESLPAGDSRLLFRG